MENDKIVINSFLKVRLKTFLFIKVKHTITEE